MESPFCHNCCILLACACSPESTVYAEVANNCYTVVSKCS